MNTFIRTKADTS